MPFFTTKALRERSQRLAKSASIELREAASERGSFTFFLSHSFRDADVIRGLRQEILEMGFSVYIDWVNDPQLDRSTVTRETAAALRERMARCKAMLYATSPNSTGSRWMPWEVGYFDARSKGRVAILPLFDEDPQHERFDGQEYLGLYPYVVKAPSENTRRNTLWVQTRPDTYVSLADWVEGREPQKH